MIYRGIQVNDNFYELNIEDYFVVLFVNGKRKKTIQERIQPENWKIIIADYIISRYSKRKVI